MMAMLLKEDRGKAGWKNKNKPGAASSDESSEKIDEDDDKKQ